MSMKGIRIHFDGQDNTVFDFRSAATDKELLAQQVLINIATTAGSDPVFPDRGTTLHQDAINGLAVNKTEASHIGNFAALDTKLFLRSTGAATEDGVTVARLNVDPINYDILSNKISYEVQIVFSDGTSNPTSVTSNG